MSTVVDLLEEVFETDKFKKLASRIEQGKVGAATIESFYERWPMWASSVRIDASPGALTPFAFAAWRGHGSDNLAAAWPRLVGADDDGRTALHRVLLKHLLFCDAVAVPDPFVARDAPGSGFRIRVDGLVVDEESTRRWMARVLRSLESYADLVRAGVLRIVPAPELPEAHEVILLDGAMTDEEKGAFLTSRRTQVSHMLGRQRLACSRSCGPQITFQRSIPIFQPWAILQSFVACMRCLKGSRCATTGCQRLRSSSRVNCPS